MSLVVNHNLMAANTARNLNAHYGRLQTSTQRLSSGLRINSAADDAAGLAIRELQRADIAALQQGARNANDAISMIQVADGALGIIDEKLIRMKELAEQAATGTYDSTQRLMIESEYQAMASEITRIANATDFNGTKLLDGTLDGDHDGSGLTATGKMKIHFGAGNDSAEDYYYITVGECTSEAFGVGNASTWQDAMNRIVETFGDSLKNQVKNLDVNNANGTINPDKAADQAQLLSQIDAAKDDFKAKLEAVSVPKDEASFKLIHDAWVGATGPGDMFLADGKKWDSQLDFPATWADYQKLSPNQQQKVQYAFGQAAMYNYGNSTGGAITNRDYGLESAGGTLDDSVFEADNGAFTGASGEEQLLANALKAAYQKHGNRDFAGFTIETQEDAQHALDAINNAIVEKDKIRAHLGATQNRLENTVSNLNIQAENLQAAESRISDVDVATEMTQFVRNQILTQSAVAMLGQANSLPQMAMQLIGG